MKWLVEYLVRTGVKRLSGAEQGFGTESAVQSLQKVAEKRGMMNWPSPQRSVRVISPEATRITES